MYLREEMDLVIGTLWYLIVFLLAVSPIKPTVWVIRDLLLYIKKDKKDGSDSVSQMCQLVLVKFLIMLVLERLSITSWNIVKKV